MALELDDDELRFNGDKEGYFEGHLTMAPGSAEEVKRVLYGHPNFHLSEIAGDAVMGDKRWVYATASDTSPFKLLDQMNEVRKSLEMAGVTVVRKKIEAVLLDERFDNGAAREVS